MLDPGDLHTLLACTDCDALYERPALTPGDSARCTRCGSVLLRNRPDPIGHALAYSIAGLILFVPANFFTYFSFGLQGRVQPSTITGGARALAEAGYAPLGALIFFTSVLAPLLTLLLTLCICLPLKLGRVLPGTRRLVIFYMRLMPWGMLSVYLLGAMVAIIKMGDYGRMELGHGFYAFLVLLLLATKAQASLQPDAIWRQLEAAR